MDEFVSKKLLVAKFNQLANKYIDGDKRQRGLAYTTAADMIALADAADVQPISQWISVKDRLPEEQQCILAYEKDYGVMWGDYQGIKYSQPVWIVRKQGLIIRTTEVTHWQPLPEPPQD